jgi:hypothetical protein
MKIIDNLWQSLGICFTIILVILIIVVLTFDLPDPSSTVELTGLVDGLYQAQSDTPSPTVFLVKLSSGNIVQVKGTSYVLFRKEKKVRIIEQKTMILKRRIYKFVGYVEENQDAASSH